MTARARHTPRRSSLIGAAALMAALAACNKPPPPLDQTMAGAWRAKMEVGHRASKDPIVRGVAKFFGATPLEIFLDVGPGTMQVRRHASKARGEVVQRASYTVLDGNRIALSTEAGRAVVVATPGGCYKDGTACLQLNFVPDASASPAPRALEAMGFLFGCDDAAGEIRCAGLTTTRSFFRYAKKPQ